MTKTIFFRAKLLTRLSQSQGYLRIVGHLINRFILLAENNVSEIKITQIIGGFQIGKANVAVLGMCCWKGNKAPVYRLLGTQVMRGKNLLSLPFFRENVQDFSKKIFEYPGIQLINRHRNGRLIIHSY